MPDEVAGSRFEHAVLEQDIARLAAEVKTHKERPETVSLDDQQILKMAIKSIAATAPTDDAPAAPVPSQGPLPSYAKEATAETKLEVEYLLDTALHQGLDKANEEAKKSNPFVVDAFHDALTGKLYEELQKRGLLK